MGNQRISEIEYRAGLIKEHFEVDVDPVPYFKPFLFYDIGMIGSRYDGNNIYHSAGLGVNIYGFQFMLASRLDRDSDNWSVLFPPVIIIFPLLNTAIVTLLQLPSPLAFPFPSHILLQQHIPFVLFVL